MKRIVWGNPDKGTSGSMNNRYEGSAEFIAAFTRAVDLAGPNGYAYSETINEKAVEYYEP